jgi:hypothetical protein
MRNTYEILVGNPDIKILLGRARPSMWAGIT